MKDVPVDRFGFRSDLIDSLDKIFEEKYDKAYTRDVLEGKVFGIGIEAFTVGSHDFYLGYAATHGIGVCFDTGHYLPTETIIDKLSSVHPICRLHTASSFTRYPLGQRPHSNAERRAYRHHARNETRRALRQKRIHRARFL